MNYTDINQYTRVKHSITIKNLQNDDYDDNNYDDLLKVECSMMMMVVNKWYRIILTFHGKSHSRLLLLLIG